MNGKLTYSSNSNMSHTSYFQMYLHNGSIKNSTNSLVFGGSPGSPTISIGGAPPAYASAKNSTRKVVSSGNNKGKSSFVSMKMIQ